jgi:hypothetical protein
MKHNLLNRVATHSPARITKEAVDELPAGDWGARAGLHVAVAP